MNEYYKKWYDRMMSDPELHRQYLESRRPQRRARYRRECLNRELLKEGKDGKEIV